MKGEKNNMKEYEYTTSRLREWYKNKIRALSITTPPFNTILIFETLIIDILRNGGKVLYIWGGEGENKKLLDMLKKHTSVCIESSLIKEGQSSSNIAQVNYNNLEKVRGDYDLAIFDDISTFSKISKQTIAIKYLWLSHISKKIIIYSVDRAITIGDKIDMAHSRKAFPFVEPRFLTTRIDLRKDIPYILYDYLNWFLNENKNAIMYVPDEETLSIVYEYYSNTIKIKGVKVICKPKKRKNIVDISKIKDSAVLIITDYLDRDTNSYKVENAVVLFADSNKYNYKKLLYICGQIGALNKKLPEVLFVSNEITEDMKKVKKISQGFNRKVWERKYKDF